MAVRRIATGKPLKPPSIDQEKINPSIIVVIVEGEAATGGLQQIFVMAYAAIDCHCIQAGFLYDVVELHTQRSPRNRRFRARRRRRCNGIVAALMRTDMNALVRSHMLLRGSGQRD